MHTCNIGILYICMYVSRKLSMLGKGRVAKVDEGRVKGQVKLSQTSTLAFRIS